MKEIKELYSIMSLTQKHSLTEIERELEFLQTPLSEIEEKEEYIAEQKKKSDLQYDAMLDTYKHKTIADYEIMRQQALNKIKEMDNIEQKINYILETAENIRNAVKGLYYHAAFKDSCRVVFMIEVCRNMIVEGATLSEIVRYVPGTQMGDIYNLAKRYFGIEMDVTEEERKEIEEYKSIEINGKYYCINDLFGKSFFMEDAPQYNKNKDVWNFKGDANSYDICQACTKWTGAELNYPYYLKGDRVKYAKSFDEVLEAVLRWTETFSIEGVEKFYGVQELHMIKSIQDKVLA